MQPKNGCSGNFTGKLGIKRLKSRGVCGVVNGIKPDLFFDRRVEHGRVIGRVDRAKTRSQRADTLIAIDFDFEDFYRQRIAGLCAIDKKWPGQRIIARSHAERVARLLDGVTETIHGICFQDIAGLQMRDRTVRRSVSVFQFAGL